MRYVRTVIIPRDGGLPPVDEGLAAAPDVSRELLHDVSLLDDGTAVTLFQPLRRRRPRPRDRRRGRGRPRLPGLVGVRPSQR